MPSDVLATEPRVDHDADVFRDLRHAAAPHLPLGALPPVGYAAKHALFEARSDQRARLTAWLVAFARTVPRPTHPLRVLSIGCGDGSVDAEFARSLATGGAVTYVGVEPHGPSGTLFLDRVAAVPGVTAAVETRGFEALRSTEKYDVIIAVHSLYYVESLASALERAKTLLVPGGRLVVIHAPLGRLNRLVGELAPGRAQEFSDGVARELAATGWDVTRTVIDGTLDLTPGEAGTWNDIVDFIVQAVVPDALLPAVSDALRAIALTDTGARLLVAHPVDVFAATP